MSWSASLSRALVEADGSRVPLGIGQRVEVKTKGGELVATGVIRELLPRLGAVRVADSDSGADLQIELDPKMYDVWVVPSLVPGEAPMPVEKASLAVNPRRPGVYGGRV